MSAVRAGSGRCGGGVPWHPVTDAAVGGLFLFLTSLMTSSFPCACFPHSDNPLAGSKVHLLNIYEWRSCSFELSSGCGVFTGSGTGDPRDALGHPGRLEV